MTVFHHNDSSGSAGRITGSETRTTVQPLSLRPKEAAKALGIGTRLLWEKTNNGEIHCVRIGRCVAYPLALLEQWRADQVQQAKQAKGGAQ